MSTDELVTLGTAAWHLAKRSDDPKTAISIALTGARVIEGLPGAAAQRVREALSRQMHQLAEKQERLSNQARREREAMQAEAAAMPAETPVNGQKAVEAEPRLACNHCGTTENLVVRNGKPQQICGTCRAATLRPAEVHAKAAATRAGRKQGPGAEPAVMTMGDVAHLLAATDAALQRLLDAETEIDRQFARGYAQAIRDWVAGPPALG